MNKPMVVIAVDIPLLEKCLGEIITPTYLESCLTIGGRDFKWLASHLKDFIAQELQAKLEAEAYDQQIQEIHKRG
jgi:hypothetical protein